MIVNGLNKKMFSWGPEKKKSINKRKKKITEPSSKPIQC